MVYVASFISIQLFKIIISLNLVLKNQELNFLKIQNFLYIPGLLPAKFPNFHREWESKKGLILTGNGNITGSRSSTGFTKLAIVRSIFSTIASFSNQLPLFIIIDNLSMSTIESSSSQPDYSYCSWINEFHGWWIESIKQTGKLCF